MNTVANEVLCDGFAQLDQTALKQIADHCYNTCKLAIQFSNNPVSLISHNDEYRTLRALGIAIDSLQGNTRAPLTKS